MQLYVIDIVSAAIDQLHTSTTDINKGKSSMNKRKILASTIALMMSVGAGTAVLAQDDPDSTGPDNSESSWPLEEIIVTATKRSKNLQEVPISISAFSGDQIESLRSSNLEDLSGFVPNLVIVPSTERNESEVTLRGFGKGVSRSSGQSVGLYVDGVYVSSATALNIAMMDVESVEVLKGPQGTLFGRDTIGGAISVTTRVPDNEFSGHVEAEIGNLGHYGIQGGVDLPIVDDVLAMRASFQKNVYDGYIRNEYNGWEKGSEDTASGRIQLFYTPADNFSARLVYTHIESDNRPNSTGEAVTGQYSDLTRYTVNVDSEERAEQDADALSLSMIYDFDSGFSFTSITAWSEVEDFYTADTDFTPMPYFQEDYLGNTKEWSQELRLTSPEYGKFSYIAGAYYLKAENNLDDVYPIMGEDLLLFYGVPKEYIPPDVLDGQKRDFASESLAFYIHGDYHATDKLTIFGGVRQTTDEKQVDYAFFGETLSLLLDTEPLEVERDTKDTPLTWTIGASYTFSKDVMGYTSVATGYRSSTFKDYFVSQDDLDADSGFFTEPEYATNYEVGLKLAAFENRLRTNVSVFYMDYTDIQASIAVPPMEFIRTLTNAASATVKGFEIDVIAAPIEQLLISASIGYVEGVYDDFLPSPGVDYSGEDIGGAPAWTSSITADYDFNTDRGEVIFHLDYNYRSELIVGPNFDSVGVFRELSGYGLLGAWVGYEDNAGWNVRLWAKNILESDDVVNIDNWNSGGPLETDTFIYEKPRTYGVTAGYRF